MAKIPFLFRRKNVFYFRIRVPVEYQELFKSREIVQILKTEKQAETRYNCARFFGLVCGLRGFFGFLSRCPDRGTVGC